MDEATVELRVPVEVYERVEAIAGKKACTTESVMLDGLSLLFGPSQDLDLEFVALNDCDDHQLWALVHKRFTPQQDARLQSLLDLGNEGTLRSQDENELAQLVAMLDRQTIFRSKALALLQRRGHDLDQYFDSAT